MGNFLEEPPDETRISRTLTNYIGLSGKAKFRNIFSESYAEERASRRPLHKVSVTINIYAAETARYGTHSGQSTRYPEIVNVTLSGLAPAKLSRSAKQPTGPGLT